jgi:Predicted membrane protein (DUF2142)
VSDEVVAVRAATLPWLLAAGFAALSFAWLFATPPGAAPDEPAALTKALAAGRLQLLGEKPRFTEPPANELAELNRPLIRVVSVPSKLAPPLLFGCNAYRPATPASCTGPHARGITELGAPREDRGGRPEALTERRTDLGTYQPFVFVGPGLVGRLGSGPASADRLARLASALFCLALIACAIFLLWVPRAGAVPLLGILVALTPMAIFVWSASLTGSGPEIAGGICTVAALLRLTRPGPMPAWGWLGLAAGALALCASRSLGPVLLAVVVALVALFAGGTSLLARFREGGRAALAATVVVGAGCAANLVWQFAVQPSRAGDLSRVGNFFRHDLNDVYREMIGVFGWLDTRMNHWMYLLWTALLVGFLVLAFSSARGRQRWALLAGLTAPLAVGAVASLYFNPDVARVQGRWLLPVAVALPMIAGEILWRNPTTAVRVRLPWVAGGVAVLLAGIQLEGWYASARRQAVGVLGPHDFITRDLPDLWRPPGGWVPWSILALAGAIAIAVFGLMALRQHRDAGDGLRA